MASPSEKLAQSLEILHRLQDATGAAAIRARDMTRTHRERLLKNGQSLSLHGGNWTVPQQLVVRSPRARNKVTKLPHGTSLLDLRAALPAVRDKEEKESLRIFSNESALIECSPQYFSSHSTDVRAVLAMIRDVSGLLGKLLDGGHSTIAGRLAGAFRNSGRDRIADEITKTMSAAGYDIRETDPFNDRPSLAMPVRETSPYANRIRLLWQKMREAVMERFPKAPGVPRDVDAYMKSVEEAYVTDAYHSLSIEGYRVTAGLIDRVRNAMAARGYWQSYQVVQKSILRTLKGENPGVVAEEDHREWYREMFAPSVAAGLLKPSDLAGYRNGQVYIRQSMHVPLNREALRDAMPVFFDLLRTESDPAVRVVLGHFVFVYIHPYMDGHGRVGRFLMNLMLASGGYPWTVIPTSERKTYMESLEQASVREDIGRFADFLSGLTRKRMAGEPLPEVPKAQR